MASPKKSVHTPSTSFYRSSSAAGDLLTASASGAVSGSKITRRLFSMSSCLLVMCLVYLFCSLPRGRFVDVTQRSPPPTPPPPQKKNGCEGDNLFWRLVSLWLGDWTRTGLWTLEQKITPESPSLTTFKIL